MFNVATVAPLQTKLGVAAPLEEARKLAALKAASGMGFLL